MQASLNNNSKQKCTSLVSVIRSTRRLPPEKTHVFLSPSCLMCLKGSATNRFTHEQLPIENEQHGQSQPSCSRHEIWTFRQVKKKCRHFFSFDRSRSKFPLAQDVTSMTANDDIGSSDIRQGDVNLVSRNVYLGLENLRWREKSMGCQWLVDIGQNINEPGS